MTPKRPSANQDSAYSFVTPTRPSTPSVTVSPDAQATFKAASQRQTEPGPSEFERDRAAHPPKEPIFNHPELLFDKNLSALTTDELDVLENCQKKVNKRLTTELYKDEFVAMGRHSTLLWCKYCKTDFDPRCSKRLDDHLGPVHFKMRVQHATSERDAFDIRALLQHPDCPIKPDAGLEDTYVILIVFLRWVLMYGVTQSQFDGLRQILIDWFDFTLCDLGQLRTLIPFIRFQETAKIRQDMTQGDAMTPFSVLFDGSTLHSETELIMARYVTPDFFIREPLIRLRSLDRSQNGDTTQKLLEEALTGSPFFMWSKLVAYICDNAQTNINAVKNQISSTKSAAILAGCFSHMCDHVGDRLVAVELKIFKTLLVGISQSPALMAVWLKIAHSQPVIPNNTRWWSEEDFYMYWLEMWPILEQFLEANIATSSEHYSALRILYNNKAAWRLLHLQMTFVAEASSLFVMATYITESRGLVVLHVAKYLDDIIDKIGAYELPMTEALIEKLIDEEYAERALLPNNLHQVSITPTTSSMFAPSMPEFLRPQSLDEAVQAVLSPQPISLTTTSHFPSSSLPGTTPTNLQQTTVNISATHDAPSAPTATPSSNSTRNKKGSRTAAATDSSTKSKGSRSKAAQISQAAQRQSNDRMLTSQPTPSTDSNSDNPQNPAHEEAVKNMLRIKWHDYVASAVKPALQYFKASFCDDQQRKELLEMYRRAAIFHPNTAAQHATSVTLQHAVKKLECFPFLKQEFGLLIKMERECTTYLKLCHDHPVTWPSCKDKTKQRAAEDEATLVWWRLWGGFVPTWCRAARAIFSIQPSSGAVERKFSIFKRLFKDKPRALADMQEAALMLHNDYSDRSDSTENDGVLE